MIDFYDEDDRHYLYIISRRDMSPTQCAVQSAHAAYQHKNDCGQLESRHPAFVMLTAENEGELMDISWDVWANNISDLQTSFIENYGEYDNQVTAIAVGPIPHDSKHRKIFKGLPTLKVCYE